MGVLSVSVDDLFGYSKLQELLLLIIGRINEHDGLIEKRFVESSGLEGRMQAHLQTSLETSIRSQENAMEKLRAECDGAVVRLQESLEAQSGKTIGLLASVEANMKAHCEQLAKEKELLGDTEALRLHVDSIASELRDLQAHQNSSNDNELKSEFQGLLSAFAAVDSRLAAMESSNVQVGEETNAFSLRLSSLSDALSRAQAQLEIGVQVSALASIQTSLDELRVDAAAAKQTCVDLEHRLVPLEADLKADVGLRMEETLTEFRGRLEARIGTVEVAVQGYATVGALLPRIEALEGSEQNDRFDRDRTAREMSKFSAMLEALSAKGSSTTTRCMSCFDRRYQEESHILKGADGKIYHHADSERTAIEKKHRTSGSGRPRSAVKEFNSGLVLGSTVSTRPSTAAGLRRSVASVQSESLPDLSSHGLSIPLIDF